MKDKKAKPASTTVTAATQAKSAARQARLRDALRKNLHRRKQAQKSDKPSGEGKPNG